MSALSEQIQAWLADCVDHTEVDELRALLASADETELTDRFAGPLRFGTAGLRGPLRAGPNGMNRTVVRRTAAGLTTWLRANVGPSARVVIGYDARHGSRQFAQDSAAVFTAAGFTTQLLPRPLPTPVLAFAVQHLHADLGIMVTASHNRATDNGYKVYLGDGAQIAPPVDIQMEEAINGIGKARKVPMSFDFDTLEDELVDSYVTGISALVEPPRDTRRADLRIVHTALHGVGTEVLTRVFHAAGFSSVFSVSAQAEPDPDFPTVAYPNPEEPGALDLALELAADTHADIVIANDPDADRCAVAVPAQDGWRVLTGNDVGVLLADALMRRDIRGTYATTIVSSTMLRSMAVSRGIEYRETLTGFKWISRAAPDLSFAYEEALGYSVAPNLVRDKDGISAALLVADLAATLKADSLGLSDRLDELHAQFGVHATDQISLRLDALSDGATVMSKLRANPPPTLSGEKVEVTDLLPDADVLTMTWPTGRVVIRPSGTEPKLKAYLELVVPYASRSCTDAQLASLRKEVSAILIPNAE